MRQGRQACLKHDDPAIDRRIKIKIKPGRDVEMLRLVRDRFPDLAIMADANSAYTLADAEQTALVGELKQDDQLRKAVLAGKRVPPEAIGLAGRAYLVTGLPGQGAPDGPGDAWGLLVFRSVQDLQRPVQELGQALALEQDHQPLRRAGPDILDHRRLRARAGQPRSEPRAAGGEGVAVETGGDDGPAAAAGLRQDDVIIAINGEEIYTQRQAQLVVAGCAGRG